MHTKYGFLYDNYTRRHPYWETTEMLRKFAIAFIPVSARNVVLRFSVVWQAGGTVRCVGWEAAGALRKFATAFTPARDGCRCGQLCCLLCRQSLLRAVGSAHGVPKMQRRRCAYTSAAEPTHNPQVFIPSQAEGSVQAACAQVGGSGPVSARMLIMCCSSGCWLPVVDQQCGCIADVCDRLFACIPAAALSLRPPINRWCCWSASC